MTISPNRAPRWSDDLDAIFFGIHEVEMKEGAGEDEEEAEEEEEEGGTRRTPSRSGSDEIDDDEKPGLVIWHWKDPRLQRAQELQANRDRNFNYLSVYWVGSQAGSSALPTTPWTMCRRPPRAIGPSAGTTPCTSSWGVWTGATTRTSMPSTCGRGRRR